MSMPSAIFLLGLTVAEPPTPVSFLGEVAPILVRECVGCHNPKKAQGGYDLTTHAHLTRGGTSGGVIAPGEPDESRLVEMIRHDGEPRMPYKLGPLAGAEVALIERWVAEGAKFDGEDPKADWVASWYRRRSATTTPGGAARSAPVAALAFSPDGERLIVPGDHELVVRGVEDGAVVGRIGGLPERIEEARFSPDGRWFALAGGDPGRFGTARLFRVDAGGAIVPVRELVQAADSVYAVAFSADGRQVATAGADKVIHVFDVDRSEPVAIVQDHADWILGLAFRPDGHQLATASRDGTSKVFNLKTRTAVVTFSGHAAPVHAVAFAPDGSRVATGGEDGQVRLWSPDDESGRSVALGNFAGAVLDLRFAPDGQAVIAASADGTIRLLAEKIVPRTLGKHEDWVYSLTIAPDGRSIASGGWGGEVRLWKFPTGQARSRFTVGAEAPRER